jgi:hypothetical protein
MKSLIPAIVIGLLSAAPVSAQTTTTDSTTTADAPAPKAKKAKKKMKSSSKSKASVNASAKEPSAVENAAGEKSREGVTAK